MFLSCFFRTIGKWYTPLLIRAISEFNSRWSYKSFFYTSNKINFHSNFMKNKNYGFLLWYFFVFSTFFIGCSSNYRFEPLTPEQSALSFADAGRSEVMVSRLPTTFILPEGHNSYVCACRVFIPLNCVNSFECGLVGSGTSVSEDRRFCDLGTRESKICLNAPLGTVEEVDGDCSGRVRSAVLLGLRWAFRACRGNESGQHCGVRIACTAISLDGTVRTHRVEGRCNENCWPEPLAENIQNARAATYVPRSMQLLCSESEVQLSSSQQNVCGVVEF